MRRARATAGTKPRPDDSDQRLTETAEAFFENNTAYSIMVVANLIARITTQGALAGEGLTLPAWRVLRLVQVFGPIPAASIISTIGMDKTAVSRIITYLYEAQLIELTPNAADRRQTLVSLTATGRRLHDRIAPIDVQFDRSFESLLTPSQIKEFRAAMRALHAHAQSLLAELSAPAAMKRRVARSA